MHPKAVTDSTNYWIPQVTLEGHVSSVSPTSKPPDSKVSRRALLSTFFCCVGVEQGGGDSVTSLLPQRHNYFSWVVFSLHCGSTRAHTSSPLLFFLLSSACHLLSRGWTQHRCSTTAHLHGVRRACGRETCAFASLCIHVSLKTTAEWWVSSLHEPRMVQKMIFLVGAA